MVKASELFRFLFTSWVILLSPQLFSQQQTITSKGDHNTNANMNGLVNIIIVGNPDTKTALQSTAKKSFGNRNVWQGLLVPSSDRVPDSCVKVMANTFPMTGILPKPILDVRIGTNEIQCSYLPCNIVRTNRHELLAIEGKPGAITVQAKVLDKDGNIIVSVENSKFYVNPNRTYRPPVRNDKSSLKVFDEAGNAVLDLRYANPQTLIVQGIFHANSGQLMLVDSGDAIHLKSSEIGGRATEQSLGGSCNVEPGSKVPPGYYSMQLGDFLFGGSPPTREQLEAHSH